MKYRVSLKSKLKAQQRPLQIVYRPLHFLHCPTLQHSRHCESDQLQKLGLLHFQVRLTELIEALGSEVLKGGSSELVHLGSQGHSRRCEQSGVGIGAADRGGLKFESVQQSETGQVGVSFVAHILVESPHEDHQAQGRGRERGCSGSRDGVGGEVMGRREVGGRRRGVFGAQIAQLTDAFEFLGMSKLAVFEVLSFDLPRGHDSNQQMIVKVYAQYQFQI